jgi:ABC-type bacteriocin/lantibiotic exporter with double-glycine peptidase domain
MAAIVSLASVWPVLEPAFNKSRLAKLQTRMDTEGICIQQDDYDCAPAAAVTVLRRLGFPAEESEVAILSGTTRMGTESDLLAEGLREHYAKDGLVCEYRLFNNLQELKSAGLTLAVVKFGFLTDHMVAVFEVNDKEVIVGDPSKGLTRLSHDEFRAKWRFIGVVLKRKPK